MSVLAGLVLGFIAWFVVRYGLLGFFTVDQNERAVKTVFGKAQRAPGAAPGTETLEDEEKDRYTFPQVQVIGPGGPYFKMPWEKVYKVSVATQTMNMAYDPETPTANKNGTELEAVTKDQLNTGLTGQIRFKVSEKNLYAYLFGVKNPLAHVMGFFISILRQRIANFEAPDRLSELEEDDLMEPGVVSGVSINDLRKNLQDLNDHMIRECGESEVRYGIVLDASLITGIDPPQEVDSALAAINTAHNEVSSDISLARAQADQRLTQSKRAVEIATFRSEAEVEPLTALAEQLTTLKANGGSEALAGYVRYVKMGLLERSKRAFLEVGR